MMAVFFVKCAYFFGFHCQWFDLHDCVSGATLFLLLLSTRYRTIYCCIVTCTCVICMSLWIAPTAWKVHQHATWRGMVLRWHWAHCQCQIQVVLRRGRSMFRYCLVLTAVLRGLQGTWEPRERWTEPTCVTCYLFVLESMFICVRLEIGHAFPVDPNNSKHWISEEKSNDKEHEDNQST